MENVAQAPAILSAPRAIVLVSVPWSPWPHKSRDVLALLESGWSRWSPDARVGSFGLWPEGDAELNRWYERMRDAYAPRFALHGQGYSPFWWLVNGRLLECLTKPYEFPLEDLQRRSAAILRGG